LSRQTVSSASGVSEGSALAVAVGDVRVVRVGLAVLAASSSPPPHPARIVSAGIVRRRRLFT
jgi:hypothetical protein